MGTDAGPDAEPDTVTPAQAACDELQPRHCLLPWPSARFLEADPGRVTGYTLAFPMEGMPTNNQGKAIDPTAWRRVDGFGTGTSVVVHFPELDLSGFAGEDDIGASLEAGHPSVILEVEAEGATPVAHWAEVDGRALGLEDQATFLRPARVLKPNTRYVVAFRNLKQQDGSATPKSALFDSYLAGTGDARQARMDEVFGILEGAGWAREDLTLAWDFVTASDDAMHGRLIEMRDKALAAVGEDGPELVVTEVNEYTEAQNAHIAFELVGTYAAPLFVKEEPNGVGGTAWAFNLDENGDLAQNGTRDEPFWIRIPRSALDGTPHGLMMHGHGQNGQGSQVRSGNISKVAFDHHLIPYATDMRGMSEEDVGNILTLILDLTNFNWHADRLHQGVVNHVVLNRAIEKRLPTLAAIVDHGVVVNTDEHFYQGISQGGIYGPTVVALSPYIQRGHLGVPGANYGLLLSRSKNFDGFYAVLDSAYPDRLDQAVGIPFVHTLWEQTDSVSWYRRLQNPPHDTPPSQVLLAPAKGDHQVAVVTCEIIARSEVGVHLMANYDTERTVWGVEETPYPATGSGLVLYDFGNPWPPASSNLPPTTVETPGDPHGKPRKEDHHNEQMVHFWRTGEIIDVCNGDGCTPD